MKRLLLTLLLLLLPTLALAADPPAPVAATGQTTQYATGDDGNLQRGVPWPVPRFTDNGDGTVTDHLTDLIWLKNADCFGTQSWANALTSANSLASGACGLTDGSAAGQWRLPNIIELESLNAPRYFEAFPADFPFTGAKPEDYWSSTTDSTDIDFLARTVHMSGDNVSADSKPFGSSVYVWPVRDGQISTAIVQLPKTGQTVSYAVGDDGDLKKGVVWPSPRFADNNDGTVTDNLTGLTWLKNANCTETVGGISKGSGTLSWLDALAWSNALATGACGLNDFSVAGDWRLPNRRELISLVDFSRTNPPLPDGSPFIGVQPDSYFSSTTHNLFVDRIYALVMGGPGYLFTGNKSDLRYVWPVRGGYLISTVDLAVVVAGNGSVTSDPAGIDCGDACSAAFDNGAEVTLTATPAAGHAFTGWSGGCSGAGVCTVTMGAARSVTATFAPQAQSPAFVNVYPKWPSLTGMVFVYWGKSPTPGATYELQLSSNGGEFVPVKLGALKYMNFMASRLPRGSHVYRLRAIKAPLAPSEWRVASPVVVR